MAAQDSPIIQNSIARRRREKKISQEALATTIGISVTQLSRLERGVSSLNQKRLRAIADALDTRPEALFQTAKQYGDVRLEVMHEIVRQLDELLIGLELSITPKQRADMTIQFYTLELDRIDTAGLTTNDVDLSRYEPMVKTLLVQS